MTDRQTVEFQLGDVASSVDWPDGDVVDAVRRRIESGAEKSSVGRVVWKAAVAAVLASVLVLSVPTGRQAIARLLGVAGIEVTFGFDGNAEWSELGLGEVVTVEQAKDLAGWDLSLPKALAPPDELRVTIGETVIIHALWNPGPNLPAVPETDTGALLTQFESRQDATVFHKALSESTTISLTSVGGEPGLWIEGAPHELRYQSPGGTVSEVISRLAANVLMWETDGTTFRLETSLALDDARRIAASVAPLGPR